MKIKEVMQRTGLSEKTIRYYEACGLIHTITSRSNGRTYHEFDENSIAELQNILMLRKAEFSIEEIRKMQQDPTCISAIVTAYQQRFGEKKKIIGKLIADDQLQSADDWKDLSFRIHRALTRIEGYESPLRFGQFDPESEAEKQSAIDAYYQQRKGRLSKRTERWLRGISAVFLVLLVVLVLVPVYVTMKGEADAVCDALIGAENVRLGLGAYVSEDGTTANLSETELQTQINAFNDQVKRYYSVENPCYNSYQELNEDYLRNTFAEQGLYRVSGGVLDHKVHKLHFNFDRTEATLVMTMIAYNFWLEETEEHRYRIVCVADPVRITASMVKEAHVWKLKKHEEYQKLGDAWMPEQVLYEEDAALTLKSGSESQQEKILEAAAIAEQEYDSFTVALNAASEINVQEICPLSARSSYR